MPTNTGHLSTYALRESALAKFAIPVRLEATWKTSGLRFKTRFDAMVRLERALRPYIAEHA